MTKLVLGLVLLFSGSAFAQTLGYRCGLFAYPYTFILETTDAGVKMSVRVWDEKRISGLAEVDVVDATTVYSIPGEATLTMLADGKITGSVAGHGWGYCIDDPSVIHSNQASASGSSSHAPCETSLTAELQ